MRLSTVTSPCSLSGSVSAAVAAAGPPWPGTEPPACPCLRAGLGAAPPGKQQVPAEGRGHAGLVLGVCGGGSRQEAQRHSGGCCESSGSVLLTIFPSPPSPGATGR